MKRARLSLKLLGEFLIIVIGILSALAVNDYQESRAEARQERALLERLLVDIALDTADVSTVLHTAEARARATDHLLASLGDPASGQISAMGRRLDITLARVLQDTVSGEHSPGAWVREAGNFRVMDLSRSAFDEAQASGRLDVIHNIQLREAILYYYWIAELYRQVDDWVLEADAIFSASLREVGLLASDAEFFPDAMNRLRSSQLISPALREVREKALIQADGNRRVLQEGRAILSAISLELEALQ